MFGDFGFFGVVGFGLLLFDFAGLFHPEGFRFFIFDLFIGGVGVGIIDVTEIERSLVDGLHFFELDDQKGTLSSSGCP